MSYYAPVSGTMYGSGYGMSQPVMTSGYGYNIGAYQNPCANCSSCCSPVGPCYPIAECFGICAGLACCLWCCR